MRIIRPGLGTASRALLAGLATTLVLVTAGGCGFGSDAHNAGQSSTSAACQPADSARCGLVRAPAPAPVTLQEARAVLTNYTKINNDANQKRSRQLNDQIETDAIRAQSQAEYTTYSLWTDQEKESLQDFSYTGAQYFIPSAATIPADQAPWFAVLAHGSWSKTQWAFMVFVKTGTAWKLSAETAFDMGQSAPPISVDEEGYATAVDPDSAALALRPSALPLAVNDNYLTGGLADGAVFATTPDTTAQRKANTDVKTFLRPYAASEYTTANDPFADVYALQTTDGGALVIASSVHAQHDYTVVATGSITLGPHARERAWINDTEVTNMTTTYTCLDAAAIPPTGKVHLLGSDCEITGAS